MTTTATKNTSITLKQARDFMESAAEREQLGCTRIAGFHLMRTKAGASWRYRYTDLTGKRRVYTIGTYPALIPEVAALSALDFRSRKADPQAEQTEKKRKAVKEKKHYRPEPSGHTSTAHTLIFKAARKTQAGITSILFPTISGTCSAAIC